MAMGSVLTIVNATGSNIMFTNISQVNDDTTWTVKPQAGTLITNRGQVSIEMGNSSVFIAPRGVGADCSFMCQGNFQAGNIYFDDPAVGAHSFSYGNTEVFSYMAQNTSGNNYTVTISLLA